MDALISFYRLLIKLYPRHFRQTFGVEMTGVFRSRLQDAARSGAWPIIAVFLHELRDAPRALLKAHWVNVGKHWQESLHRLRLITATADLPPPPPDGRWSWTQLALEASLFLLTAGILIASTYLPQLASFAWRHDLLQIGAAVTALTLPVFLLGLARGLPRWAYPYGGLLLAFQTLHAGQSGLWPFLLAMLLAYGALGFVALLTSPQPAPLPTLLRRITQSITLDWTRLSFAVFGATPLAILVAFDDGRANTQTPFLAFSVASMVICAFIYCQSRRPPLQLGALLAGTTLSIGAAWLDMLALAARVALPAPGRAELVWLLTWWLLWATLIVAPALLRRLSRPNLVKRTVWTEGNR